jgi:heat shock protein HtpX
VFVLLQEIARNKRRSVVVVALFVLVWVGIGALLGVVFSGGSSPGASIATGVAIAAAFAGLAVLYAITAGSKLVLAVSGAKPADRTKYAQLYNVVEEMAIAAGLPTPAVYVIDDASPNAFATGTSPKKAAITVTTGLLAIMNRQELEGVISHEMSHIKNYDVRLILIVTTLIGFAALLASLVWRSALFMPRGKDSEQATVFVIAAGAVLSIVAFIVGPLIQFALSRRREELADVSGANLTRNPAGLIHALQKLQQNDKPFKGFNHATAAMCIDDPLQHHNAWYHRLFDTHPPLEERIAILEKIEHGETV